MIEFFGVGEHKPVTTMKRIILFGDSITQQGFNNGGWAARLASRYVRRADVYNRGLSGYNTVWARLALQQVFADFEVSLVHCRSIFGCFCPFLL